MAKGVPGNRLNLRNAKYRDDDSALDEHSEVRYAREFSKGYIHHLLKVGELLAIQIVAQHNVAVINRLMREVRAALKAGTLDTLEKEWLTD